MRITLVVTILLSLCGVGICATSQSEDTKIIKPTKAQEMTGYEQRGTEETPVVVKIIPPKINKVEAYAAAEEKEEKKTLDSRLVFFTACLAAIGLMQLIVFGLQARRLRQTVEATKEAADAAKKSAEAAELTAQAAIGAELPRFVVTDMVLRQGTDSPYATITLTNHGRTEAVITGECAIFQKKPSLPPNPRYPVGAQKLIDFGKTVKSGESHQIGVLVSPGDITDSTDGSNYFIIWGFGFIRYRDFLGENHIYGFVGGASIPSNSKGVITAIDGIHFQQQGPTAYAYNKYDNQET